MLAGCAQADAPVTLQGAARVVDGDTLEVAGTSVRLFGIDAPERGQSCDGAGGPWPCGRWAGQELARLTTGQTVRCTGVEADRYGRLVARCAVAAGDLGAALVEGGAATAYRRYALDYVPQERRARAARRGIWGQGGDGVQDPAAFRAEHQGDEPGALAFASAPEGCVIKGNISANGRIYHRPGQRDYARTRVNTAQGERWFCTEAEARAAGWRPAAR
jgi:endonuclease YncB( thermonuclease family)